MCAVGGYDSEALFDVRSVGTSISIGGAIFIAIAYNFLLRLLRPKRGIYRHSQ
jgi:hypothetical protein